jgi:hypothetical protein
LRIGSAYLASGEIDQAAKLVSQAARLAAQNGSARLVEEFRTTCGHLRPWAKTRPVREMDEQVISYGLA